MAISKLNVGAMNETCFVIVKDAAMRATYEKCRRLAADTASEFYRQGRVKAAHRDRNAYAYWSGR